MPRNLRRVALLVELFVPACWSSSHEPTPTTSAVERTPAASRDAAKASPSCVEGGDRVAITICRHDGDLDWTITNRTDTPVWAFVAPPAGPTGNLRREHAVARAIGGKLVLMKMQLRPLDGEAVWTGAVSLEPGESDHGVIPLGDQVDLRAQNFTGVAVTGTPWISTVVLEVGFAPKRPGDRADPAPRPAPFVILTNFDRKRQELARSPELTWR